MDPSVASSIAHALVAAARSIIGAGNAVMVSAVNERGEVGPSQCFVDDGATDLFAEAVDFAVMEGTARVVLATSLAHLVMDEPAAIVLTTQIEKDFRELGIELLGHVIVSPGEAQFLVRNDAVDQSLTPILNES